tara:strand:+ start:365 stop:568 length:204 start_codon:yes stop_codon:yes gene_type:complete
MTALKVKWYTGSKGKVGIAKVQADNGDIEYRISPVDGFLEHMDVQQVVAWGGHFPVVAGEALFGEDK